MKLKLFSFGLVLGFSYHMQAQPIGGFIDRTQNFVIERNRHEKKDSSILGTPYSIEKFMPADIDGAGELVLVRYNNQADEVEIEYDDKILILPKKPEFGKVSLRKGKTIKLLNYVDVRNSNVYGYLFESYIGEKISLYLRERTIIVPAKEAQNGYDSASPARYSRTDDEYYFSYKGAAIVAFPDSKKELIAMYPENKKEIEDFLKTNKLKFKTEADLIKIATFLDSL